MWALGRGAWGLGLGLGLGLGFGRWLGLPGLHGTLGFGLWTLDLGIYRNVGTSQVLCCVLKIVQIMDLEFWAVTF